MSKYETAVEKFHKPGAKQAIESGEIHYLIGFKLPKRIVMWREFFPPIAGMQIHYVYFPRSKKYGPGYSSAGLTATD